NGLTLPCVERRTRQRIQHPATQARVSRVLGLDHTFEGRTGPITRQRPYVMAVSNQNCFARRVDARARPGSHRQKIFTAPLVDSVSVANAARTSGKPSPQTRGCGNYGERSLLNRFYF